MTQPAQRLPEYAELDCISNFSLLTGASRPEELVETAHALGYQALALTDECSVAGVVRAHVAALACGLHLIIGARFRCEAGPTLLLLAPDRIGYGDLCSLITDARRNTDKGSYKLTRALLEQYAQRLLALWVIEPDSPEEEARWLHGVFGERLWLGVSILRDHHDQDRMHTARQYAEQLARPIVAHGRVQMHEPGRGPLHDTLTAIRLRTPVDACGFALASNREAHLRSRSTLSTLYPQAWLAETLNLARRCTFKLTELRFEAPSDVVPAGVSADAHLTELTRDGLAEHYPDGVPEQVRTQASHELTLIAQLGYAHFFLTVHDIVRFARSRHILCQGRGSAANSVVCFALGITSVRPEESHLLFERFISVERGEPPDIDVDFEHQRRPEVIDYLYQRYGRDRVALAATVISYRTRSSLRDAGRALGFSEDQLARLTSNLAWWDSPEQLPQRMIEAGLDARHPRVRQLLVLARALRRFPRHLGQHVGGFVISAGPLHRLVPIENTAMPGRTIIQWDKDDLEALGLLKVDVLALGMLSAIRRALELVSGQRGTALTLATIPREDPAVYDMLCRGDAIGVFQVESRAQLSMLPRLKPRRFYDLVVEVAIVRPGPIQGDMVHPYLRRRDGIEAVDYPSEAVRGVLERTLGVPIFQEQVMQIAIVAAGFSPGDADALRRAMASWRHTGKLERFKQQLVDGMDRNGYAPEFSARLIRQIEGFSEYGFPESHAASFALLVYASAWLKCHEPAAFLCAMLNALPMGFYSASQLIQDARRHGVTVLPVCIQRSSRESTWNDGAVRLGFNLVRQLPEHGIQRLMEARPAKGFADLTDLQRCCQLDRTSLTALTDAGALATLAGHRRSAHWQVAELPAHPDLADELHAAPEQLQPPTATQDMTADYRSTGLSLAHHPLQLLRSTLHPRRILTATQLGTQPHGRIVRVCGLVTCRQRPGTASGVTFVTLEDETGLVNVIVWQQLGDAQRRELLGARLMTVYGIVQRSGCVVHVLAKRLVDDSPLLGPLVCHSRDFH
ncbi:error-prone DNA polymerase [Chitinibacteraceae bacterium HSL-7]